MVELIYFGGLTEEEAAETLGISLAQSSAIGEMRAHGCTRNSKGGAHDAAKFNVARGRAVQMQGTPMTPERWKRTREIFDSALKRSADAGQFARAECGGDEELYSEVLRMLEEHRRTGFLDRRPATETVAREDARCATARSFYLH